MGFRRPGARRTHSLFDSGRRISWDRQPSQKVLLRTNDLHFMSCYTPNRFWVPEKPPTVFNLRFRLCNARGDVRLKADNVLLHNQANIRPHFDAIRECLYETRSVSDLQS